LENIAAMRGPLPDRDMRVRMVRHMAIVPWARFSLINVAEWESVQLYEAALNREGYRKLAELFRDMARYYPGLYEVVRT
jgi:hypothetical protein